MLRLFRQSPSWRRDGLRGLCFLCQFTKLQNSSLCEEGSANNVFECPSSRHTQSMVDCGWAIIVVGRTETSPLWSASITLKT